MTNKALFVRSKIPDAEQLQNSQLYTLILELEFDEMIPFVLSNIRKNGVISRMFAAINVITLIVIGIYSIWGFFRGEITWPGYIAQFILGIVAGSLFIIPFHELLHGLAYKILGARRIQFGANLKQFFFYVTANRFPVNRLELYFLALLPFIVLNAILLMMALFWMPQYLIFFGFLLFSHNLMCIGDFAIANYVSNEQGEVFSFDEIDKKKSYFYRAEYP